MSPRVFSAVWIAVQFVLPLHYYLVRTYDDPLDEAYAWRMFSDTHHSASYVDWYRFDKGSDKGVLVTKGDLISVAGLSKQWAGFMTGQIRGHSKAPPNWMIKRTAEFLCGRLKAKAVGARSTGAPWVGEVWEQEYVWDC